jgi:hypothetical protein
MENQRESCTGIFEESFEVYAIIVKGYVISVYLPSTKDTDMSILRGLKFFQVFLVISTLMASLSILPLNGYCNDKWVQAGSYDNNIIYYNPSSVKIDKKKKIINVSSKWVFTEKGKSAFLKKIKDNDSNKLKEIDHSLIFYSFNYKNWKFNMNNITEYSKSDKILHSDKSTHEWKDIPPNSVVDALLKNILQKYNIKR